VASCLGMAWLAWGSLGAGENTLQPSFAALAVLFGLGVGASRDLLRGHSRELAAVRGCVTALCLVQLVILAYNPRATVPVRSEGWASDRFVATLSALPGRLFAPEYGEWSRRAGKGEQPSLSAAMDLVGGLGADVPPKQGLEWTNEIHRALAAREYDAVLL